MAKFMMGGSSVSSRLQPASAPVPAPPTTSTAELGKIVKLVGESRYGLAAAGDQIEGFIVAVESATLDGYTIGSVKRSRTNGSRSTASGDTRHRHCCNRRLCRDRYRGGERHRAVWPSQGHQGHHTDRYVPRMASCEPWLRWYRRSRYYRPHRTRNRLIQGEQHGIVLRRNRRTAKRSR